MKILTKSLIIIVLFFVLKITHSCDCPDNPHYFDFDQISVINLDNSRDYVSSSMTDTMYSSSVAFEITVSGNSEISYLNKSGFSPGFSVANARTECPLQLKSNQQISKITILTLESFSSEISSNTDVTDHFVGQVPYSSYLEYLYEPIDKLYDKINPGIFFNDPASTFQVFCKVNIQNDKARFAFVVELSDGRTLTCVTNLINLIPF